MQEEMMEPSGHVPDGMKENDRPPDHKHPLLWVSLALNVMLVIGVAILYYLFLSVGKERAPALPPAYETAGKKALSVVFVNIDSLNSRYDFVRRLRNDLESTGRRLQTEVLAEQSALQKEADEFQRQIANNAISEEKAKTVYDGLMKKQQDLMEKKDRYTQQVADQELSLNIRLLDTVTNFLRRYNARYHYDYILAHKTAGEILIANDTLDITNDVIHELNAEYAGKK